MNLLKFLQTIRRNHTVGTLILGRQGKSLDLFVEEDRIFFAGREHSGRVDLEGLNECALPADRVSTSTIQAILTNSDLQASTLPQALHDRGLIDNDEYTRLSAHHLCEEIYQFAFRRGDSFLFRKSEVPERLVGAEKTPTEVSVANLTELIHLREEMARHLEFVIPSGKEVFVLTEKGMAAKTDGADYGLSTMFSLIDGFRTLEEISRDFPFFEFYLLSRLAESLQNGYIKKTVLPEIKDVPFNEFTVGQAREYFPWFKLAVKYSTDELVAREKLARIYEILDEPEEAVIQYNFMGDSLYRMNRFSHALKAYQRAYELSPGDPLVTDKVVKMEQDAAEKALADGDREAALKFLGRALAIRPDNFEITDLLLDLCLDAMETNRVSEICDAVARRSREMKDLTPALRVLRRAAEKFPNQLTFRRKIINLYIDFDMEPEAIKELEELAREEVKSGHTARANEVWEKILRMAPGRNDIRRLLRQPRKPALPSLRRLKVSALRLATVFLIIFTIYQYWSYLEFKTFKNYVSASSLARPEPTTSVLPTRGEEEVLTLANRAESFKTWFPLSFYRFQAGQVARVYRQEGARMAREREELKERIYQKGLALAEKGQRQVAVRLLQPLLQCPVGDPWHQRALKTIDRLEEYERLATELAERGKQATEREDWEEAYRLGQETLSMFPLSNVATEVVIPVVINTIPPGSELNVGDQAIGTAPRHIMIRPGHGVTVQARAEGHEPATLAVTEDSAHVRTILLNRNPQWRLTLPTPLKFSPLISEEQIILVQVEGTLSAVSRRDGSRLWTHPGKTVVAPVCPPVEFRGQYFLALNDGQILLFNRSGKVEGRIKPRGLISTSLLISDDTLVFGTSGGVVTGWRSSGDQPDWVFKLEEPPVTLTAIEKGRFLASTNDGWLVLFDARSHRVEWKVETGKISTAGPWRSGSYVLAQNDRNRLVAVNLATGKVMWRIWLEQPYHAISSQNGNRVLFLEQDGNGGSVVKEIQPQKAHDSTSHRIPQLLSALHDRNGLLGASLAGGGVAGLDPGSFEVRWAYRSDGTRVTSFEVADDSLLVVLDGKELLMFKEPKSGTEIRD